MPTLTAVSPLAGMAGGESALMRLLPELAAGGWSVRLTVPGSGRLLAAARARGIETRRLPLGPPERRSAAAWLGAGLAPAVLAGSDAVLLNGLPAQRVVPALRLLRRPALLRVNNPLHEPPPAWSRRGHWERVRVVVADSEHVARECVAAGAPNERVSVAYPAAWSGDAPPGRNRRAAAPAGRVGFVGQLEPRKGVVELVRAAHRFLESRPHAELVLTGEPPPCGEDYARRVREEVAAGPAAGRIRLTGFRADAAAAMAELDLLVVPSLAEPFGTVAAEAAAAGTPVVASAVGGLPEVVVDGDTGVLVPAGDVAALAGAVGGLLDDSQRLTALGRRALELSQRFSPTAYARRIDELLRGVLS